MTKNQIITYSIIGAVAIVIIVLLFVVFRSMGKDSQSDRINDLYKQLYEEKQQQLNLKDEIIADKLKDNDKLDVEISALRTQDSISRAAYLQSQKLIYQNINERLKNIPTNINAIANDDNSIRAAFARD